jgi:hypothetical protein
LERKPLTEHELQELGRVQRLVQGGSHYDVLGITLSASKEDIDAGYHPSSVTGTPTGSSTGIWATPSCCWMRTSLR